MEKIKQDRAERQKELGLMKASLHEQRAFFEDVIQYMRKRGCTRSENKARRMLTRWCKLKIAKISQKINDLNTRIWQLVEESKEDLQR